VTKANTLSLHLGKRAGWLGSLVNGDRAGAQGREEPMLVIPVSSQYHTGRVPVFVLEPDMNWSYLWKALLNHAFFCSCYPLDFFRLPNYLWVNSNFINGKETNVKNKHWELKVSVFFRGTKPQTGWVVLLNSFLLKRKSLDWSFWPRRSSDYSRLNGGSEGRICIC
jgi:hypothetical protein